jgi:hypothetical protein
MQFHFSVVVEVVSLIVLFAVKDFLLAVLLFSFRKLRDFIIFFHWHVLEIETTIIHHN